MTGDRRPLGALLHATLSADPGELPELVASAVLPYQGTDVVVYLIDYQQVVLQPMADRLAHLELPLPQRVGDTMAGRAFTRQQPIPAERSEGIRMWVPITERHERVGVLAVTFATVDDDVVAFATELGLLLGHIVSTANRYTDVFSLHRRRRAMTLAASMQWDLLAPVCLRTSAVVSTGLLEPAYDVGGDAFEHAINGPAIDVAIFDALGHGVRSAVASALALGAYRHDRREGRQLEDMHRRLDSVLAEQFDGNLFVTGQLSRLDTVSGELRWTNAGHPLPLHLRGHRVVGELACDPTLPFGLLDPSPPCVATVALQPGDSVLFYTDGVTEARTPDGEEFGLPRLIELLEHEAGSGRLPEEILRRLVRSVMDHRADQLRDDATLLLLHWPGSRRPSL